MRMILSGCPDQMSLPFALWTREAVQQLLSRKFGVAVSVWTVGRYLRAWGLTPQKPVRRAYERDPAAVRKWLEQEYLAIRESARRYQAQIHWLDEMGLRSDHQAGRSTTDDAGKHLWSGDRATFSVQHDLCDHQSRAASLHDFSSALHGTGLPQFSGPSVTG